MNHEADDLYIFPSGISDRVEVVVMSGTDRQTDMPEESLVHAKLMDESSFAKNVLKKSFIGHSLKAEASS